MFVALHGSVLPENRGLAKRTATLLSLGMAARPGFATRYDLGLMEEVAKTRGIPLHGCGIAIDGPPLASFVDIVGMRTGVLRRCKVIDVSETIDLARHLRTGLVELDHHSARAVCGRWWRGPWRDCPVRIKVG